MNKAEPVQPPADVKVPQSVAIIMDGNGRWARERGLERVRGHERGTTAVRESVEQCAQLGVEALTLYAFSEENWQRPRIEIKFLMALLKRFLVQERDRIMRNNIRLVHAGRRDRLPEDVLVELDQTIAMSKDNTGMHLCLAISYGGRAELTDAVIGIAHDVQAGNLSPEDIDEDLVARHLYQPHLPYPDLLIRTASELRVSNFLLWQISYAEIYVTDVCWPDFRKEQLWDAFVEFGKRTRKFGVVKP